MTGTGDRRELRLRPDPNEWLARAVRDIELAKTGKSRARYTECVLLCQRSVEKALSAYLLRRGLVFELTHDLRRLLQAAMEDAIDLRRFETEVAWLASFQPAVPSREMKPPEGLPTASALDLDRAFMVAEPLLAWVRAQFGIPGA